MALARRPRSNNLSLLVTLAFPLFIICIISDSARTHFPEISTRCSTVCMDCSVRTCNISKINDYNAAAAVPHDGETRPSEKLIR